MGKLSRYGKYRPGQFGLPHMGDVFADYRKRRGDSQETFAIVCGTDKQSVVYWEGLPYFSDMERRIFLSKVLHIPPALIGLTWRNVIDEDKTQAYIDSFESLATMLEENSYGLYEDVLTFAYSSPEKYSPEAAYRFYKHQQELERIVERAPEAEKDDWKALLSRYYQHSTFIAQHHKNDEIALSLADKAVNVASTLDLEDAELLGAALYRRARVHLVQSKFDNAREDINCALKKAEHARGSLRGSNYLLAAEIHALYAQGDEQLKTQCRKWQDMATELLYKRKCENDGTFLSFDLYAVHHERAKVLARFSLFSMTDNDLLENLKQPNRRADARLIKDAQNALSSAKSHLDPGRNTRVMDFMLTEARIYLIGREFEESARTTKQALQIARIANSQKGLEEAKKLHRMLTELMPSNPYIRNLGVELGLY